MESTPGVMVVKSMRNRGEDPATPLCLQERESNVQGPRTTLYYDGAAPPDGARQVTAWPAGYPSGSKGRRDPLCAKGETG